MGLEAIATTAQSNTIADIRYFLILSYLLYHLCYLFLISQYLLTKQVRLDHHSRHMERSFEYIAFSWLGYRAVTMQIAIPFAKFFVFQMVVSPFVGQEVHC